MWHTGCQHGGQNNKYNSLAIKLDEMPGGQLDCWLMLVSYGPVAITCSLPIGKMLYMYIDVHLLGRHVDLVIWQVQ